MNMNISVYCRTANFDEWDIRLDNRKLMVKYAMHIGLRYKKK